MSKLDSNVNFKVYCPQFSIKIRLLHSYLAGDLLNSTNFVLLLLVNEMGTPRIPKLNAIIRIDMHKKLVVSNSNRLWIKALQLSLHNISLKNLQTVSDVLFFILFYCFIELLCFVFQWCYKIWGMKFQQKSIYVSILALTGWTIFFIQCINQKSKWNGKSQSENIDFLRIFSEFELLVCFRTIVKTMENWENAVCVQGLGQ